MINKIMRAATVLMVSVILTGGTAFAQTAGFTVDVESPAQSVQSGTTFDVFIRMDPGSNSVKFYKINILYNSLLFRPLIVQAADSTELNRPVMRDNYFSQSVDILDSNNFSSGCSFSGVVRVSKITFLAIKGANSVDTSPLNIMVNKVMNCLNEDVTTQFVNNTNGNASILPPVFGGVGASQFLDLTGDGLFDQSDADAMNNLVSGNLANTELTSGLNIGGLQGDINGNGLADLYDVGLMNAMSRDINFISTGPNGLADTSALATDAQVIPVGQGRPDAHCVDPGLNATLDSTPSGDDAIVWDWLSTGANGICESSASGDDVQTIPLSQGFPYALMIKPGPDKTLETTPAGDDVVHNFIKDMTALMASNPPPGRPFRLVKVSPLGNPSLVRQFTDPFGTGTISPSIPLVVRVEDEDGEPIPGIAPTFTVTAGNGWLDDGVSGAANIDGLASDLYLSPGEYQEGAARVSFYPAAGSNTVQVSLAGDPSKGIIALAPVTFDIETLPAITGGLPPNTVTITVGSNTANLGDSVPVTIKMLRNGAGVHGLADKLILFALRNVMAGFDPSFVDFETITSIFFDDFESGLYPISPDPVNDWVENSGNAVLSSANPGFFGNTGLEIAGKGISVPVVFSHKIDASSFFDLQLGYQWAFNGDPQDGDYMLVEYSTDGGVTFTEIQKATGAADLYCFAACLARMVPEKWILSGDNSISRNPGLWIRYTFAATTGDKFWLDNVALSGVQILFEDDFESESVGSLPMGFDPVDVITTGDNGISETVADASDIQLIPTGQGKAFQECVLPGPDNILDTAPAGDDNINGLAIETGADGICDTPKLGNDFQMLPVGQGQPYTAAVAPGTDQSITSVVAGDDDFLDGMGPDPYVVVDNTIGPSTAVGQGHNASQNFAAIGRIIGGSQSDYALRKNVNVEGMENVWLSAWTHTYGQANVFGGEPGQRWLCEVSDNGGKSFVKIWESSDTEENVWTLHKVCLSCDPRLNLKDNLIIQWRATMDSAEEDAADQDATYVDDIMLVGTPPKPDIFGPVVDTWDGSGTYTTTLTSITPGMAWLTAAVLPASVGNLPQFAHPPDFVDFRLRKIDPNTVRVIPQTFSIKACETMNFMVVGHYLDQPGTIVNDITAMYDFDVAGPARISPDGRLVADCFLGSSPPQIKVNAIPVVPTLYDPGGGGGGQQTGYIDGKVFESAFPYTELPGSRVRVLGGTNLSTSSGYDGSYLKSGVPIGSYTVQALQNGYVLDQQTGVQVLAGETTSENLFQDSGSDTDGDTTPDGSDGDDDNDGVADGNEASTTCQYDPDCDGDDYGDDVDAFPLLASEWEDTDGDTVGDNSDPDDDGDGISDSEEEAPGADGYITDPKLTDTDGDGLGDYEEINTHNTDPSLADTDGGGRNDGAEVNASNGFTYDPLLWSDDNQATPVADAGFDSFAALSGTAYLNGYNSAEAEGDAINYSWVQLAGPASMAINSSTAAVANFNATWTGTYTFSLQVSDWQTSGTPDNVVVYVSSSGTDTDGDGLYDSIEADLGSNSNSVDTDGDGILDLDEFWNPKSDILTSDVVCNSGSVNFSLFCWGDADGDGLTGGGDIIEFNNYVLVKISSFSGVYPGGVDTGDIDGNGLISGTDAILLNNWVLVKPNPSVAPPASVTVEVPASSVTVPVGATQVVTVKVVDSDGTPRSGVGVVFEITGNGALLGGRGSAAGLTDPDGGNFPAGSRWDVTGLMSDGGLASIVVRVDGGGPITVNARVPKNVSKGLASSISIASVVIIN